MVVTILLCLAVTAVAAYCYMRFLRFHERPDVGAEKLALMPWIALAITLLVTLLAWAQDNHAADHTRAVRFAAEADKVQASIVGRARVYDDLLAQGRDVLASRPRYDFASLSAYARSLQLEDKHPYVGGIGFAAYVTESRLGSFLAAARRRGDFQIFPSVTRPETIPVAVAEPDARLGRLRGYDLASDPEAKMALASSRERSEPTLSPRLVLPDDPQHPAFLYLLPVSRVGTASAPSEDEPSAFRGWVFLRLRADEFLKNIVHEEPPVMELQAFDGGEMSKAALFYDSTGYPADWSRPSDGPLALTRSLDIGGRRWTLHFTARPAFDAPGAPRGHVALWVLGFGFLLSMACFACVAAIASARRRAVALAEEMTSELQQRNAVLANGPDGIVIVDATATDYPVQWVNARFEKMTGYAASEILGKNCRLLQGTDRDQKGIKEIRRSLQSEREAHVLLRNYRKDGTPFWNELTVAPVRDHGGRVIQFVGYLRDVTEREQSERRLATQSAVIRALSESPSVEEAAVRVLQALCEGQDWDLGAFWEVDPRNQVLRCLEIWHAPEIEAADFEHLSRDTTLPRGMGLPGQVWAKGEAVWIGDLQKETDLPETAAVLRQGLISGCGFPIASRRGLQGVLAFYSRKIWPFNKNLLLLMVTTSNQISQFLERQQNRGQKQEVAALERGLAEFMGDGMVAMDREGYCIYANSAAGKMLGYGASLMLGQNLHNLLHPADFMVEPCDAYRCPVLQSLQSTEPCRIDDHQVFYTRDRVKLPVAYTTAPIIDQGLIRGVVITMNDVSAQRARVESLERSLREKEDALQQALQAAETPRGAALPMPAATEVRRPKILLVEEDVALRASAAGSLVGLDYELLQAASGDEALRLAEHAEPPVDLLVTDCILAQMSGKALAERVRAVAPQLRVLYVSTYTLEAIRKLDLLEGGAPFLQKPLNPDELTEKIRQILA